MVAGTPHRENQVEHELRAVVDNLQSEEDHEVPKLYTGDAESHHHPVLHSQDEEGQLKEYALTKFNAVVREVEEGTKQEHKDWKEIEETIGVGECESKFVVEPFNSDKARHDDQHKNRDKEDLVFVAFVEDEDREVKDEDDGVG
jgi:hypothetical protein